MAAIRIFCTDEELSQWLQLLCEHKHLASLTFRSSTTERVGKFVSSGLNFSITEDIYRIFLFPQGSSPTAALTMNEVQARRWGWLDIRPGHLVSHFEKCILLQSQIHGEDFDIEPVHPAKYVEWLRQRIKPETYLGVKIRGEDSPEERIVRDIRYSKQARTLHYSGVLWKQFVDGAAIFSPIDHTDDVKR